MGSALSTTKIVDVFETRYLEDPNGAMKELRDFNRECNRIMRESRKRNELIPTDIVMAEQFKEMDYNGNGLISLAEIDKLIVEKYPIYNNKPALIRSYKAADSNNDGFITLSEFKNLWNYINIYNDLWSHFADMDVDEDRRISRTEFKNLSYIIFNEEMDDGASNYYFNLIDKNGGGMILFEEFCKFMIIRKVSFLDKFSEVI
tara:strand:+ start:6195 stop:6803 length:609 start_codon:yes stop_codon:yes gene_type:complete